MTTLDFTFAATPSYFGNQANLSKAAAEQLYESIRRSGWLAMIWSALASRTRQLRNLAAADEGGTAYSYRYGGQQTVRLSQISGSATTGRSHDFDTDFRPTNEHNRDRWLSVAAARLAGVRLPPVSLVQIGTDFYVQDGHHRISVARALGQEEIEATVMVAQVVTATP